MSFDCAASVSLAAAVKATVSSASVNSTGTASHQPVSARPRRRTGSRALDVRTRTRSTVAPVVDGTCSEAFLPLRELLERNIRTGEDAGASVAVVRDGELVVDLWGGE